MKRLVMLGVLLACLTACAAPPAPVVLTKIQVETPAVPTQLLSCAPAPAVPADAGITQADVAVYVAKLWDAHEDCFDKLAAVKKALAAPSTPTTP